MHVQYHHHRQNSSFHKKSKLGFIPEMKDNRVCVCVWDDKSKYWWALHVSGLIKLTDEEWKSTWKWTKPLESNLFCLYFCSWMFLLFHNIESCRKSTPLEMCWFMDATVLKPSNKLHTLSRIEIEETGATRVLKTSPSFSLCSWFNGRIAQLK